MSQAGKYISNSGAGGFIQTLTSNAGGPVPPTAGNINVNGGNNIFGTGNPGLSTITFDLVGTTNHAIQVGNATGSLTSLAVAGNGQIPIGSVGVNPVIANITAGPGIAIANGPGSITVSALGAGFTWNEVVGVAQNMAVENGYIANNVGLVTLTLPAVAAVGDEVAVVGKGTGGWLIAQNAGQVIHLLGTDTTPGAGGSLASTVRYDCLELICITANTDWVVRTVMGNLVVV